MSTTVQLLCSNNAVGKLSTDLSSSSTSLVLSGSEGNYFPTVVVGSSAYYVTLEDTSGNIETVLVTNRVGNTMTIERGSGARAWTTGTEVSLRVTAELLNDKVSLKSFTEGLATKLSSSGGSMTGGMSFANKISLTATDGDSSIELECKPNGEVNWNGSNIALLAYPVGSIYLSTNSTSPATLFGGGTWARIGEGLCLVDCGETYAAGVQGGSATHTLTVSEMPAHDHGATSSSAGAHVHGRGTMNISGALGGLQSEYNHPTSYYSGAFSATTYAGHTDGSNGTDTCVKVTFDASRGWTGETSSAGAHTHTVSSQGSGTAFNIMNPYFPVYMWKRTA